MVKYLRSVGISLVVLMLAAGAALAAGPLARAATEPAEEPGPPVVLEDEDPTEEEAVTGDVLEKVVDNFELIGITTTAEEVEALAAEYGLGGAIRIINWANARGKSIDEVTAMLDKGNSWGQIAKELGVSPGNGSIMNGGHGKGQTKDKTKGGTDEEP